MTHRIKTLLISSLLFTVLPLTAQELPSVKPGAVGLSSKKLDKVDKIVGGLIASNRLAVAVAWLTMGASFLVLVMAAAPVISSTSPSALNQMVRRGPATMAGAEND